MIGPKTSFILERISSSTEDGTGGVVVWESLRKLTGVLIVNTGTESIYGGKITPGATHALYIDKPKALTITERDRLKDRSLIYDILYITDFNKQGRQIRLDLKELK